MSYEQIKTRTPARSSTKRAVQRVKDRMREGGLLMQMHSTTGMRWYLLPNRNKKNAGREVEDIIAEAVIREPEVFPNRDGMWPGCDQTYRIGEP